MTANISNLFQQTLQTSSTWIREIAEAVPGADEQQAYHLLCATLRTLRDRLPISVAPMPSSRSATLARRARP